MHFFFTEFSWLNIYLSQSNQQLLNLVEHHPVQLYVQVHHVVIELVHLLVLLLWELFHLGFLHCMLQNGH
jgi:hypothetical protein